jgi:hypothetical protein
LVLVSWDTGFSVRRGATAGRRDLERRVVAMLDNGSRGAVMTIAPVVQFTDAFHRWSEM